MDKHVSVKSTVNEKLHSLSHHAMPQLPKNTEFESNFIAKA